MQFFISVAVIISSVSVGVHLQTPPNEHVCDFDSGSAWQDRAGHRSGKYDDAISTATCGKDHSMILCRCQAWPGRGGDCDGARMRETKEGTVCDAYNGHGGKGVVAKVLCQKIEITCSTPVGNMPSIRCPSRYLLIGCTMHSSIRHNLWYDSPKRHPVSKMHSKNDFHMDAVFVIDGSSGYSSNDNPEKADIAVSVSLAVKYLKSKTISKNIRYGTVVYSHGIDDVRNMSRYGYHYQVPDLPYTGTEKALHEGLDEAADMLFSTDRGGRPGASKIVMVITDGECSDVSAVEASIAALRSEEVIIVLFALKSDSEQAYAVMRKFSDSRQVFTDGLRWISEYQRDGGNEDYGLSNISDGFPKSFGCCPDYCHTTEGCSSCSVQARCVAVDH